MQVTFVYQGMWYLMPATGEDFLTYTAQGRYIESSTGDKVQVCAVCVTDDFVQRMASILSSGQSLTKPCSATSKCLAQMGIFLSRTL